MGMSASQARLLMLTARKSDLEYQAQQITQQKLSLAQQEEAIATEYNNRISNTEYNLFGWQDGKKVEIPMTYAEILNAGYLLVDANGNPVDTNDKALMQDTGGAESYIKFMMENHGWLLQKQMSTTDADKQTATMSVDFTETYDTSDDAAAEAEYNAEIKKIHTKEKKLDLTLKQIETQHEAVKQEIESVEKIVKDNVEKTFKTFG